MEQKIKDEFWRDETGTKIPVNRITKYEKMREKELAKLLKKAEQANKLLKDFKEEVVKTGDNLIEEFMKEKGIDMIGKGKGNITLYNFDRSIRFEIDVKFQITFDDLLILACKERFDAYLNNNIVTKDDFTKTIITDAFTTTRGKLDTKKLLNLLRYEGQSTDPDFTEAMKLLKQAIRRPGSRSYQRISIRDKQGEYKVVELNFSNI